MLISGSRLGIFVQKSNLLFLGATVFCVGQAANAAHEQRAGFKEFRAENAGLSRHAARQLYRDQQGNSNPAGIAGGTTTAATVIPNVTHDLRHANHNQSFQLNDRGRFVRLAGGIDLDLGSQNRNIVLGERLFSKVGSIQIEVGGVSKTLSAGEQVTAAEYVAAKQVLNGLDQTVTVNGSGQATSGSVDFSALTAQNDVMHADSLVVPQSVTALADFRRGSDFRMTGDLDNFGTVQAFTTGGGRARSGSIHADSIYNHQGALMTSAVDLTLGAASTFTNDGTVTSSRSITVNAYQLNNSGAINAAGNVKLNAGAIRNSGVVSSQGDLNLDAPMALSIDNAGGTLSASNAINVRNAAYNGVQNTSLSGGNVYCSELNLNTGSGTVDVNVDQLTGTVNSKGTAAHVSASTDELVLGSICLAGDPTFFNTAGGITITSDISVTEALTIVAAGNISVNNGADLVAANATQGFPITLVAGASFTNSGGANQSTLPPLNNAGGVTINGGSTGGGSILFNSSAGIDTVVSTRATGGTGAGGDVTFVAFAGTTAGSGRITTGVPTQDRIFTGGKGLNTNGSITMIAPGMCNGGTFLPEMDTTGGTGGGGNISISAADPVANNVIYNSTGSLTAGKIVPSTGITAGGEIRTVDTSAAGTVYLAGNLVQVSGNTNLTARRVDLKGTAINIFGDLTASSLFTVSATGAVRTQFGAVTGQVTSPLSILTSTGSDIGATAAQFLVTGGTVIADGATGVNINSLSDINLAGGGTTTGNFVVTAHGNTIISSDIVLGTGNMDISTDAGTFSVGAATLTTSSGNITLSNLGTDKKLSKLIMTGTTVNALGPAGLGNIFLNVGGQGGPVAGKAPKKNVTITTQGTGQIFFGEKGITANAPTNSLTAKNANIFFFNPLTKKSIILSGVTLLADPE